MNLVSTDGTQSLVVTEQAMALIRHLLDDRALLEAVASLADLGPERIKALADLADSQLALEAEIGSVVPIKRLIKPVDGLVSHAIACPSRVRAQRRGEDQPQCMWARDVDGFVCVARLTSRSGHVTQCGHWEGDETARGEHLRACFEQGEE